MGVLSTILGLFGFGVGVLAGIVIGYYLFIYFQPTHVKDIEVRPLVEYDSVSLDNMLPEIPLWAKNSDYERIDWLNKFFEYMWPYLDKAICTTVQDKAKPIIAENIVNYNIDSVDFETFTLGTLPPTFQGMKVSIKEEDELIMESSLKWAGNPNILAVVKAYGMKASIQVVDLQIFASPRIILKPLVPSFPYFEKIIVSLMEKPHVDFGLKVLGGDIMAIPGLYRFAQETIKKQVASMYLWPKTLEVPILDPTTATKKAVGIVHVKVVRAQNLRKKDLLRKSDPYVKLKMTDLDDDKLPYNYKKTLVKKNNLNPEWNEVFNITVTDPETQLLQVNVCDWDQDQEGKHEIMGMNMVPLKDLLPNETKTATLYLLKSMDLKDAQNEKNRGQIILELTFKPFKEDNNQLQLAKELTDELADEGTAADGGGLLVVTVCEALHLQGRHHTNPYVKIIFKGEEKKTQVIKKNRDPRWDEDFEFMCEQPPTNDFMHVQVCSKPSKREFIYAKEALGYVSIGLADVATNKKIKERYHLTDSKNAQIQIEMQWRPFLDDTAIVE